MVFCHQSQVRYHNLPVVSRVDLPIQTKVVRCIPAKHGTCILGLKIRGNLVEKLFFMLIGCEKYL